MYRVEIVDQDENKGAFRTDDNLVIAICEANRGASAITPAAMVVGVLAWAILEELLAPDDAKAARELIDMIGIPINMRELVSEADK
jgi:hypothetical protein